MKSMLKQGDWLYKKLHTLAWKDTCKPIKTNPYTGIRTSHFGFLRTMITESPRRNILLINLSLLTGRAFFLPFPVFGTWTKNDTNYIWSCVQKCKKNHDDTNEAWFILKTNLCPHLSNIFQNHVAVSIKSSNTAQKFFVVPAVDKYLDAGTKLDTVINSQWDN